AVIDAVDLVPGRIGSISPDAGLVWVPGFILGAAASVATLAFPVVIWGRTPDIRRSRPLLASGAIAVATAGALALVNRHLNQALIADFGLGDAVTGQFAGFAVAAVVQIARALVEAVGFLWIAEGLRRLAPSSPSPTIRRLALIAAAITIGTALAALVWQLLQLPDQPANQSQAFGEATVLLTLSQPFSVAPTLAFAYVVWVLIRRIGGPGRRLAIRIGAIAAGMATVQAVLEITAVAGSLWLTSFVNASTDFDAALGWQAPLVTIAAGGLWLSGITIVLFVTAFALGIHDDPPIPAAQLPAGA
ncbi:MAG TPA: hypothetical protein VGQ85_02670, partial [Candidatus Limnocylindrales bacterium]|nr:hypothetical protein [Candidatus Limnocylindrales bacterium]